MESAVVSLRTPMLVTTNLQIPQGVFILQR
jgi:hypothetical protein